MNKTIKSLLCVLLILCIGTLTGCKKKIIPIKDDNVIVVGASSTPHAEILEFARPYLFAKGYELKIEVFSDYVIPNLSLEDGSLDANYFQHLPYLEDFNKGNDTSLVSAGAIHYEPLGLYGKDITSIGENNKTIIIPNDSSNGSRALYLLHTCGLIELSADVKITETITKYDIVNFNGYEISEVDAEIIPSLLKDATKGTLAIINGNYALEADIDINTALAKEESTGLAATTFANIIAVRETTEDHIKVKTLLEVLTSKEVKDFITTNYGGAVLPM